jgi:peptide/nickel transport system permease protein
LNKNQILKFFGYKLIRFIILMVVVAIFSFILLDLSPINPVNTYLRGAAVSEGQRAILES